MRGFITDREQSNVDRLKELSAKGWSNMTEAERAEWSGDPATAADFGYESPVNLLPRGPQYASGVSLTYRLDHILATAQYAGSYLYAVSIVGEAEKFANKTLTFSADSMVGVNGGTPRLILVWHDGGGYEFAGGELQAGGSVTFTVTPNAQNRQYLALYVYVASGVSVEAGAMVRYNGLMLEEGNEKHDFVPYTEILPTPATKGAYNYSDLNRVETAVTELSEQYSLGLITKTDWGMWDYPKLDELTRYLSNVKKIRAVCPDQSSLPPLPATMGALTYEAANNIEKILIAAYAGIEKSYRSGELYSGEV